MNVTRLRSVLITATITSLGLLSLNGCMSSKAGESNAKSSSPRWSWFSPRVTVPAGTTLSVRLSSGISSETAHEGDSWSGVLTRQVFVDGKEILPAGTAVHGVVSSAQEAARGTRAKLDLAIQRVRVRDQDVRLHAATEAVVAGSPRARNLGAIAGGAAAGALIGKAVGGDGRDAAVGGLIGGTAATGAVLASKGYQVELKSGTVMQFTVSEPIAMSYPR